MLLNINLSDFQQYRTLLLKVIQFFVSPEKCENQRYKFLTPDQVYDKIESCICAPVFSECNKPVVTSEKMLRKPHILSHYSIGLLNSIQYEHPM